MTTTTDRIMLLFDVCRDAYQRNGHRLAFPANTPPPRTYQWRYLQALAKRLDEWEFDDRLTKLFVLCVAGYAKRHNLIHNGLSIFCRRDILKICHLRMEEMVKEFTGVVERIEQTKGFIDAEAGDDAVGTMLFRPRPGAFCNLVKWYQEGKVPDAYLALTASCGLAMFKLAKVDVDERKMLPPLGRLLTLRDSLISDRVRRVQLQYLIGDDWRQ